MNDMAAAPTTDPSAWDDLIRRAKDDGSFTVTQAQVLEVVDIDVERLDQEIEAIRRLLDEQGIALDETVDAEALAAELEAQAAHDAAMHVNEVLADPLGGIDLAADD